LRLKRALTAGGSFRGVAATPAEIAKGRKST
jgi:hypothetical protein